MDLSLITVAGFKAHFRRDFPYLPEYDNAALYNAGSRVYYEPTLLFYDCLANGTTGVLPTVGASWAAAEDDIDSYVLDDDLEKAFAEAKVNFNQSLFNSDDQITLAFYYLAAMYLVNDIQASVSGLSGAGKFSLASKSVGSVSESYAIPPAYLENPAFQIYTQNPYGLKYLSLVLPRLVGNIGTVAGATNP